MSAPEVIVPNNDDPTSENAESSVSSDSPLNTCCVCLEGLHRDDTATITSCHHKLHSRCLSAMISFRAAQRQTSGSSQSNDPIDGIPCPLCRVSFDSYTDEHGERKAVTDLLANTGQWEMESPIPPPTFSPQQRIVPVGTRVTLHATGPGVIYYFSTNQFPVRYVLHRYTHPIRLRGLRTYIGATVVNEHRHSQVTTVCYETTLCGVRLSYCTLIIPILLIIACIIVFTIIAIQVR